MSINSSETPGQNEELPADPNAPTGGAAPLAEIPEEALAAARSDASEFKDRWMRSVAELENFKKRMYREREEWQVRRTAEIFEDFLRVRDDFERAMAHLPEESQDPLASGYRLLYRHVVEFCDRHGLKQFDARGAVFDPGLHDAILQAARTDVPAGTVADVALPGYMLGERVLRHAQVVVSTGPEGGSAG